MPVPPRVARFRARYRAEQLPAGYSGRRHLAGSLALTAFVSLGCLVPLRAPLGRDLLVIPLIFLIANLAEYLGHRYPMHKEVSGLRAMLAQHVGVHHRYFPVDAMRADDDQDVHVTLLSPLATAFFVAGLMLPLAGLATLAFGLNAGLLTASTAMAYLGIYQLLHLAYHAPAGARLSRLPGIERLRRHHTLHHDQRLMSRYNFNISFPIFDWILGTTWTPEAADEAEGRSAG